jgi:hypothetical protein
MSTVFAVSAAIFMVCFAVGCEAPKGVDLKAKDWGLHVPIGTAKFESEDGGFSLSKLKASEIQNMLGDDFEGTVYDGKGTKALDTENKRIFVKAGAGNNIEVDANEYQTYLVHYPVPLGVDEVKDEMNKNFNESLDEKIEDAIRDLSGQQYGGREDGFLEEPPEAKAISIPIKVNTGRPSTSGKETPHVVALNGLIYHVKLTFKPGELPKINGTGAVITSSNKNNFFSWVKFGSDNAVAIILPEELTEDSDITLEPNQIVWVSPEKTFSDSGNNQEVLQIKFDLYPKFQAGYPPVRGIHYKPDLDVHDFDTATIKFEHEKTEHLGSTGAFTDIITMLGGAEFKGAWMYLFTNAEIDYLSVYAKPAAGSTINFFNDDIDEVDPFDYKKFYNTNTSNPYSLETSYSAVKDLTEDLLCKGAPKYELYYSIPENQAITVSGETKVDAAILIPLEFKVDVDGALGNKDAVLVTGKENDEPPKQYIKLYVEQLDEMFGSDESDSFDLKSKTKDFGSIKRATAALRVKNDILPEEFKIGLQYNYEKDSSNNNRPLYSDVVKMDNSTAPSIVTIDTSQPKISMPRPALLLQSNNSNAEFAIKPVEDNDAEKDISVRIVGDIVVDFNYSL